MEVSKRLSLAGNTVCSEGRTTCNLLFDIYLLFFLQQNGSDDGLYTIYSGIKSWENFGMIQLWNKER